MQTLSPATKEITALWLAARFNGKRVVAVVDCLWGVLDGINEDGLAVSLAFRGRTAVGQGFEMPIVPRYVLGFANTTAAAVAMLRDIPVHMSCSIALINRHGNHATVYVDPSHPAEVMEGRVGDLRTIHGRLLAPSSLAAEAPGPARHELNVTLTTFVLT
ncbi:carcinine hydrolase/isopenicillin-N N-acyltransferase family protein [Rhizobium laguerreae]|nr:carcinine hydrolase/isopenicillin-N N-acyltransferase family protein [Rhizobium laguerreae]